MGSGALESFDVDDAPIYFDGFNATNYYGGPVPMYAPETYQFESSLSHLDQETFSGSLMTYDIVPGEYGRTLSDLEVAMMKDMGWEVIPEPASMAIIVFTAVAFLSVKRIFRRG